MHKTKTQQLYFFTFSFILIFTLTPHLSYTQNTDCDREAKTEYSNKDFYIVKLLGLLQKGASSKNYRDFVDQQKKMDESDYRWPVYTFLLGEYFFKVKNFEVAQHFYESILVWSENFSDNQTPIIVMAIWRELFIRNNQQSINNYIDTEKFLTIVQTNLKKRESKRLFSFSFYSALPKIKEDILRKSAKLAWTNDSLKPVAKSIFLDFLLLAKNAELDPVEKEIKRSVLKEISEGRLSLDLGITLKNKKRFEEAKKSLWKLHNNSENTEIKAESAFYLADIIRNLDEFSNDKDRALKGKQERIKLLDFVKKFSNNPELIQKAYLLASKNRDIKQYENELKELIKKFPEGELTDEALAKLGRHYWELAKSKEQRDAGEIYLKQSFEIFDELRRFNFKNNWRETSYFIPALMMYSQATKTAPADTDQINEAIQLLTGALEEKVFRTLKPHVLFWLGRMYEEIGSSKAKKYFQDVIKLSDEHELFGYGYYGIRAQMHLTTGKDAQFKFHADDETMKIWRRSYTAGKKKITERKNEEPPSQYYMRTHDILCSGLYSELAKIEKELIIKKGARLADLDISELDKNGDLTKLMLLLSSRIEAFVAAEKAPAYSDRLEIANRFKRIDPFLTLQLINERMPRIQTEEEYLFAAYPKVYPEQLVSVCKEYKTVSPDLLYSVMRHESRFFPSAVSINKALGLFQFIPSTFDKLNRKWKLTDEEGARYREKFLFSPDNSIRLGAMWFDMLVKNNDNNNFFWALARHNANDRKLQEWKEKLAHENKLKDFEYALESINYPQTRSFLRNTIANIVLVKSFDLFDSDKGGKK